MTDPMPEAKLRAFRRRLLEAKSSLESRLRDADGIGAAESWRDASGELSPVDNHPADAGTDLFERGKDLALRERLRLRLEDVEAALRRMDEGKYGICAACGRPIPLARLEAAPETIYCTDHQPRRREPRTRPAEEAHLRRTLARIGGGDAGEGLRRGFDGENAWQMVEAWGTSESPAADGLMEFADDFGAAAEPDEDTGAVEAPESFLATDITGKNVTFVRNRAYRRYMEAGEGDPLLETVLEHAEPVEPVPPDPAILELSPMDPEAPDPAPPDGSAGGKKPRGSRGPHQ
ncbi:MAG TPA: TraR/DksA C4-type zinc finger protein [Paenibacillaceae bacterium]